ncbi:MAG: glycosyltransferase family 2 protein [Deferrisomatales bacterium]|nr:glycosyltransferase family 2 protein [Deferrisomatales bacterium]
MTIDAVARLIRKGIDYCLTRYLPPRCALEPAVHPLAFARFEKVQVSVVIPVFNKSIHTFTCLKSLLQDTAGVAYEVIVVDNASTDDTPWMLAAIENITVIVNQENLGFVDACNLGASRARGAYLHFLNNDTIVTPGWLAALVDVLTADPSVGAAGSKLLYPNLRLAEAGGMVGPGARAVNIGKFERAGKPQYNRLRQVDYCSGASLMVRRDLFERIGGFDRRFAPAYWEDTDLCFALRKLGFHVLYQPASVVVHFEGVSAGRRTSSGMKRFQVINRQKFLEKWADELERKRSQSG